MQRTTDKSVPVQRGATTPQTERLLVRGGEVAAALGISRALAFRWMAEGVLPVVRVRGARTVRVPKAALDVWIATNTRNEPLAPVAGDLR